MLRRAPTDKDGKPVDMFDTGRVLCKPFRTPAMVKTRDVPQRKRKRVSYKGAQGDESDDDSDDEYDSYGGRNDDEKMGTQYPYTWFHVIFLLATSWVATLLTMQVEGDLEGDFAPIGRTYTASWVKVVSAWVCYAEKSTRRRPNASV